MPSFRSEDIVSQFQLFNIAITGAFSGVGKALVRSLAKQGHEVTAIDSYVPDGFSFPAGVRVLQGSVLDHRFMCKALREADVLVHAQIAHNTLPSTTDEDRFRVNARGTKSALTAAEMAGVRKVVYISSLSVVDGWNREDIRGHLRTEDLPGRPSTPYGWSKLAAETFCSLSANRFPLGVTVLRLACIVHQEGDAAFDTSNMARISRQWQPSATYMPDVEQAVDLVLAADLRRFEIFHITGLDSEWRPDKAMQMLGFRPTTGLRGLTATIQARRKDRGHTVEMQGTSGRNMDRLRIC